MIGLSVVGPAGLLNELATDLRVGIGQASLLITLGAIVLCLGSPLLSWATSRMDRRRLLAILLFVICITHAAAACVTSFTAVLLLRLVMLAAAAPFTPQAAGVIGLLAPPERRAALISYIFLGWSLAAAVGLPMMTALGSRYGWQAGFLMVALVAGLSALLAAWRLPGGLHTPAVDLKAWGGLLRNRLVLTLLLVTTLQIGGQFAIFAFIGPLLTRLTGAGPDAVGAAFATFGATGLIGNVVTSRVVGRLGGFHTSVLAMSALAIGAAIWAVSAGHYLVMLCGVAIWGLGFASANSMQQARLVGAAPNLAGSAVALNTSVVYVGQAAGSGLGSLLFVHGFYHAMGYAALAVILIGLGVLMTTRPKADAGAI